LLEKNDQKVIYLHEQQKFKEDFGPYHDTGYSSQAWSQALQARGVAQPTAHQNKVEQSLFYLRNERFRRFTYPTKEYWDQWQMDKNINLQKQKTKNGKKSQQSYQNFLQKQYHPTSIQQFHQILLNRIKDLEHTKLSNIQTKIAGSQPHSQYNEPELKKQLKKTDKKEGFTKDKVEIDSEQQRKLPPDLKQKGTEEIKSAKVMKKIRQQAEKTRIQSEIQQKAEKRQSAERSDIEIITTQEEGTQVFQPDEQTIQVNREQQEMMAKDIQDKKGKKSQFPENVKIHKEDTEFDQEPKKSQEEAKQAKPIQKEVFSDHDLTESDHEISRKKTGAIKSFFNRLVSDKNQKKQDKIETIREKKDKIRKSPEKELNQNIRKEQLENTIKMKEEIPGKTQSIENKETKSVQNEAILTVETENQVSPFPLSSKITDQTDEKEKITDKAEQKNKKRVAENTEFDKIYKKAGQDKSRLTKLPVLPNNLVDDTLRDHLNQHNLKKALADSPELDITIAEEQPVKLPKKKTKPKDNKKNKSAPVDKIEKKAEQVQRQGIKIVKKEQPQSVQRKNLNFNEVLTQLNQFANDLDIHKGNICFVSGGKAKPISQIWKQAVKGIYHTNSLNIDLSDSSIINPKVFIQQIGRQYYKNLFHKIGKIKAQNHLREIVQKFSWLKNYLIGRDLNQLPDLKIEQITEFLNELAKWSDSLVITMDDFHNLNQQMISMFHQIIPDLSDNSLLFLFSYEKNSNPHLEKFIKNLSE
ncbi:MAG: hypothetical protein MJB14_07515, partial [Spirochaetes bacterium]|nr:hypothetical protein [Spirochaetota bacterium]